MSEIPKLKPCPFCGGEYLSLKTANGCAQIRCNTCCTKGPYCSVELTKDLYLDEDATFAKAAALWNERKLEAAYKLEADNIHRAMVILAGIEMESTENPPRLWTALEDAYDALSDALGTDGNITADEEEAKATGRHFIVRPCGNSAAMREALEMIAKLECPHNFQAERRDLRNSCYDLTDAINWAKPPYGKEF